MITVSAEARAALARHDITTAYRLLIESGVLQREIAQATGQEQSEVSDIRNGRRVLAAAVLERIADGLGVERGLMGLGWGPTGRYDEARTRAAAGPGAEEVTEAVKRRNFVMAVAGAVTWGHPVLRELLDAPSNAPAPVFPTKLGATDVTALRDLTATMRTLARQYGGQAEAIGTTARNYTRLLTVPGSDAVKAQLSSALADLHTLAGWTSYDAGLNDHARAYYSRAFNLAYRADDHLGVVSALRHAGVGMDEQGAPKDALKLFQMGQFKLADLPWDDPRVQESAAWMHGETALAFAAMELHDHASNEMSAARRGWQPSDTFEAADMDYATALVHLAAGRLTSADSFATAAADKWARSNDRRDSVLTDIKLAEIHVATGEADAPRLASKAIDGVAALQSQRARTRLTPLGRALAARRDSTAQDLARRVCELQAA